MERRDKFDHILVETTGLANPGPVAACLWVDDQLEASVRLDSIVTVVDALNLKRQLAEPKEEGAVNEAAVQIAFADTVILNKVDLVNKGEEEQGRGGGGGGVGELEREIRSINSLAQIVPAVKCRVDLKAVLNKGTLDPKRVAEVGALLSKEGSSAHKHDSSVNTINFWVPGFVDLEKLDTWLGSVLWEGAARSDVYRMKGALCVKGTETLHVFQAVHELYEVVEGRAWKEGEDRANKVVAIGRNLDHAWMLSSFKDCLEEGGEVSY